MNPFLIYLIKATISLTFLYSLFRLTMRKHKSHAANRFLLLGIIVVSSLIPFIHTTTTSGNPVTQRVESISNYFTPSDEYVEPNIQSNQIAVSTPQVAKAKFNLLGVFYASLLFLLSLRLAISIFHVFRLIHKAEKTKLQDIILAIIKESIQPFSFMKYIVLSENDHNRNKEILIVHEYEHIRQWHGLDLILVELFTLVHCFNPMAWLLRRDLKLIHEFQADQAVLNKGIDARKYQLLVLEKAVGERRFAMATHFNQPPVKKRLNMMNKTKEKQWHSLKIILYIPLLFLLLQAFAKPEIIEKVSNISTSIIQADPSEQWVNEWVEQAMNEIEKQDNNESQNSDLQYAYNYRYNIIGFRLGLENDSTKIESFNIENKNIGKLMQNSIGDLMFNWEQIVMSDLQNKIKSFVSDQYPVYHAVENESGEKISIINDLSVKGIFYLHDVATPKGKIRGTMDAIANAFLEMRKEASQQIFGKSYFDLDEKDMTEIERIIPMQVYLEIPNRVILQLSLNSDGNILMDNKTYTFENIGTLLNDIKEKYGNILQGELITSLKIESGANEELAQEWKEALQENNMQNINLSRAN